MSSQGLVHGPFGPNCGHVCVDMQAAFLPGSPWANPWMERVLPAVGELAGLYLVRTDQTRSRLYHAIKRKLTPGILVVAPLSGMPKCKGMRKHATTDSAARVTR